MAKKKREEERKRREAEAARRAAAAFKPKHAGDLSDAEVMEQIKAAGVLRIKNIFHTLIVFRLSLMHSKHQ